MFDGWSGPGRSNIHTSTPKDSSRFLSPLFNLDLSATLHGQERPVAFDRFLGHPINRDSGHHQAAEVHHLLTQRLVAACAVIRRREVERACPASVLREHIVAAKSAQELQRAAIEGLGLLPGDHVARLADQHVFGVRQMEPHCLIRSGGA